jgi:hypothetical protein
MRKRDGLLKSWKRGRTRRGSEREGEREERERRARVEDERRVRVKVKPNNYWQSAIPAILTELLLALNY